MGYVACGKCRRRHGGLRVLGAVWEVDGWVAYNLGVTQHKWSYLRSFSYAIYNVA